MFKKIAKKIFTKKKSTTKTNTVILTTEKTDDSTTQKPIPIVKKSVLVKKRKSLQEKSPIALLQNEHFMQFRNAKNYTEGLFGMGEVAALVLYLERLAMFSDYGSELFVKLHCEQCSILVKLQRLSEKKEPENQPIIYETLSVVSCTNAVCLEVERKSQEFRPRISSDQTVKERAAAWEDPVGFYFKIPVYDLSTLLLLEVYDSAKVSANHCLGQLTVSVARLVRNLFVGLDVVHSPKASLDALLHPEHWRSFLLSPKTFGDDNLNSEMQNVKNLCKKISGVKKKNEQLVHTDQFTKVGTKVATLPKLAKDPFARVLVRKTYPCSENQQFCREKTFELSYNEKTNKGLLSLSISLETFCAPYKALFAKPKQTPLASTISQHIVELNLERLRAFTLHTKMANFFAYLRSWRFPPLSFCALVVYALLVIGMHSWHWPLLLLLLLLGYGNFCLFHNRQDKNKVTSFLLRKRNTGPDLLEDGREDSAESQTNSVAKTVVSTTGFFGTYLNKLNKIRKVLTDVNNKLETLVTVLEKLYNIFSWRNKEVSFLFYLVAVASLLALSIALFYVPFRILFFFATVKYLLPEKKLLPAQVQRLKNKKHWYQLFNPSIFLFEGLRNLWSRVPTEYELMKETLVAKQEI